MVWTSKDRPRIPQRDPTFGQQAAKRSQAYALAGNQSISLTFCTKGQNIFMLCRHIAESLVSKFIFKNLVGRAPRRGLVCRYNFKNLSEVLTFLKRSFLCMCVLCNLGVFIYKFNSLYTHSPRKNPNPQLEIKMSNTLNSYSLPKVLSNLIEARTQGCAMVKGFGRFIYQIFWIFFNIKVW